MSEASTSGNAVPLETPRRRDLLQAGMGAVALAYLGALGYPVYRYLATPAVRSRLEGQITSVAIAEKSLPAAGAATMFLFGTRPAMLIHHADGSWVAFDAVCTHLGCTVGFEPQNKRIFCPCHGGAYDMKTGDILGGPPPRALKAFKVEVSDGHVIVSRA
ncbi:MAG: Rieske (2Fe-2S) protein [Acidobacteria bacterium]|nr:Rieske (2Fe-2S) protein [Acidobacteriota bacterium]